MTDHPITLPPELVQQWFDIWQASDDDDVEFADYVAARAAQWGADHELEACCEVLARELICDGKHVATDLRMIRRPKPPSLKEQAFEAQQRLMTGAWRAEDWQLIRRALEQIDD